MKKKIKKSFVDNFAYINIAALNNYKMEEIKKALELYAQKHTEITPHIIGIQYALFDAIMQQYKDGLQDGIEIGKKTGGQE